MSKERIITHPSGRKATLWRLWDGQPTIGIVAPIKEEHGEN